MKTSDRIAKQLLQQLQGRYAADSFEVPAPLREKPSGVVFTALLERKDEGLGGLDALMAPEPEMMGLPSEPDPFAPVDVMGMLPPEPEPGLSDVMLWDEV